MMDRRDLLIGSTCVAAAAAAYALKPRKHFSLLGEAKIDALVPQVVDKWVGRDVSNLVAPRVDNSLSAKLYGETVERVYRHSSTGAEIMMLLAHGDTQTNDLQVHRPEICYPAFGFELSNNVRTNLRLSHGAVLPARRLVADAPGRRETIIYWTRLGEFFPLDDAEQTFDRLRTAISGYVADGLLARFSILGPEPARLSPILEDFIPMLVMAVAEDRRRALIGTRLAELSA